MEAEEVELKVRDPLSVVILLFWLTGLIVRCVLVWLEERGVEMRLSVSARTAR